MQYFIVFFVGFCTGAFVQYLIGKGHSLEEAFQEGKIEAERNFAELYEKEDKKLEEKRKHIEEMNHRITEAWIENFCKDMDRDIPDPLLERIKNGDGLPPIPSVGHRGFRHD